MPFTSCALSVPFARRLLHVKSVQAKVRLFSVELQTEGAVFDDFSRKVSSRQVKKKSKPTWDLRSGVLRSTPQFRMTRLRGITCKCPGTKFYSPSSLLTRFVNARLHAQNYRSIDFCNVYTYIYTYIEQSLLEVCMFFSWISNFKTVPLKAPESHDTDLAGTKKSSRGSILLASVSFVFLAANVSIRKKFRSGVT